MRDYLIINGRNLKEFGIYAFGNSIHDFPERVVEKISVPGRTGDLLIDKGKWENIDVEYSVVLLDGANLDRLKSFLMTLNGYVRIESTFEPDYYRMGRFVGASSPKVHKEAATVTLTFDCKPQKWLKSGEKYIELEDGEPLTIQNPTPYATRPLLNVMVNSLYQTGKITVTNYIKGLNPYNDNIVVDIGHSIVTVKKYTTTWIEIDCETRTAYTALHDLAMDKIVSVEGGDFPQIMGRRYADESLQPSNFIDPLNITDSYTVIETEHMNDGVGVLPRWWTL